MKPASTHKFKLLLNTGALIFDHISKSNTMLLTIYSLFKFLYFFTAQHNFDFVEASKLCSNLALFHHHLQYCKNL